MSRQNPTSNLPSRGFTMVEIMVAMVVLAMALLGMAAMSVLVMKSTRGANDLNNATNLCQSRIEELKDVDWGNLGDSGGGSQDKEYGLPGTGIFIENNLNAQGESSGEGPFKYRRHTVICKGEDYDQDLNEGGITPHVAGTDYLDLQYPDIINQQDCVIDAADASGTRTKWLACLPEDIVGQADDPASNTEAGDREKRIKVLCTWSSREGKCHGVHLATTVVNLGGS